MYMPLHAQVQAANPKAPITLLRDDALASDPVMRRQLDQLDTPGRVKRAAPDEDDVRAFAYKCCKGRVDLAVGVGPQHLDLQSHGACSCFCLFCDSLSITSAVEHRPHPCCSGNQHTHEFQPLRRQLGSDKIDSSQVAARMGKADNKVLLHWVITDREDNGDRRGRGLRCIGRRIAAGGNDANPPPNQISRQLRQAIELIVGPAVDNRDVLALNEACVLEALAKSAQTLRVAVR